MVTFHNTSFHNLLAVLLLFKTKKKETNDTERANPGAGSSNETARKIKKGETNGGASQFSPKKRKREETENGGRRAVE